MEEERASHIPPGGASRKYMDCSACRCSMMARRQRRRAGIGLGREGIDGGRAIGWDGETGGLAEPGGLACSGGLT